MFHLETRDTQKEIRKMGEAALSYWLEEFINPSPQPADADLEYTAVLAGETDDDWRYGSD